MNDKEKKMEKVYRDVLRELEKIYPGETSNIQLHKFCKLLFKNKFIGVFSSDKIRSLRKNQCCILNLDNSKQPGSHWVALYRYFDGEYYFYDSFGRKIKDIIPSLSHKIKQKINYDIKDYEQIDTQYNCGSRSISWLICVYDYGVKNAILI
jgi:hypothetical protein